MSLPFKKEKITTHSFEGSLIKVSSSGWLDTSSLPFQDKIDVWVKLEGEFLIKDSHIMGEILREHERKARLLYQLDSGYWLHPFLALPLTEYLSPSLFAWYSSLPKESTGPKVRLASSLCPSVKPRPS